MPYFVHSEAGYNHQNEDAVEVQAHPKDGSILLCALADGQGGQYGGAAAAQIAVQKCLQLGSAYGAKQLLDPAIWCEILSGADDAVSQEPSAGYTTLIGLCVTHNGIYGASCGDSAALLINNGQPSLLTENQRKNPPVGSTAAVPIEFSARLDPGFQIVVVSDGVWKYVGWDAIIELCSKYQGYSLVSALRQLSLERNAGKLPDDFSVALLQ
jgi:serine/threonine protein phosphatase PrpC